MARMESRIITRHCTMAGLTIRVVPSHPHSYVEACLYPDLSGGSARNAST